MILLAFSALKKTKNRLLERLKRLRLKETAKMLQFTFCGQWVLA